MRNLCCIVVRCEHVDSEVPELFRKGGPLYGSLPHCGMGCAVDCEEAIVDVLDKVAMLLKVKVRQAKI